MIKNSASPSKSGQVSKNNRNFGSPNSDQSQTPNPDMKQESKLKGKLSFTSKVKNWATNLNYSINNMSNSIDLENPLMYLGKRYTQANREELTKRIAETIWFSYREKFPPIMQEIFQKSALTCDSGWGCMIRCGQMLLAEGIKRHFAGQGWMTEETKRSALFAIVLLFADFVQDGRNAPFSIHQLCAISYEMSGVKPGSWFRSTGVMVALDKLNEKYGRKKVNNFRICVFKEGTIYEDQILDKAFEAGPVEEEGKAKGERGNKKEEAKGEAEKNYSNPDNAWKNSVLIFVSTKTGLDKHNFLYLPTVGKLMRFPEMIGVLGGRGSKAYYFLGFQKGTLLYLDPHFVQEACGSEAETEEKFYTFFRTKFFQVPVIDIDTSVGFGFYIKDAQSYLTFKQRFLNAMKDDENFLVGFEKTTPSFEIQEGDIIEVDDFEEIVGDE